MREVIARHRTTGEERKGFLDEEESILTDDRGNYLDHWWEYDDLSPGFLIFASMIALCILFGIFLIVTGQSK